jgi:putative SOS response-associated peptidase YedK
VVYDTWLNAPTEEALKIQRPLPDEFIVIVAEGQKSDKPTGSERLDRIP